MPVDGLSEGGLAADLRREVVRSHCDAIGGRTLVKFRLDTDRRGPVPPTIGEEVVNFIFLDLLQHAYHASPAPRAGARLIGGATRRRPGRKPAPQRASRPDFQGASGAPGTPG